MPDNVGYTPGSGATVAADDVGGALYQRVKIAVGADGSASDASSSNPIPIDAVAGGNIADLLEAIKYEIGVLMNTVGSIYPDINGRVRVNIETSSSASVSVTGTITAVTDQTNIGGIPASIQGLTLLRLPNKNLRSNITIT